MLSREIRWLPTLGLALASLAFVLLNTYIDNDPDGLGREIGKAVLGALLVAALWCGFWALLSKIFARQSSFGWHVRVFVIASLAFVVLGALPPLLAFAFSWPWITDFAFVVVIAAVATTIYFHLLAVEPGRERLMRAVAVTGFAVGVALQVWFNCSAHRPPGRGAVHEPPVRAAAAPRHAGAGGQLHRQDGADAGDPRPEGQGARRRRWFWRRR